ncbi:MAG: hypothetical protein KAQ81_13470, partial [Deltaproteobacteria bacterium]|nr:hypothetical protein [Deltaproteobacteria bacterium]
VVQLKTFYGNINLELIRKKTLSSPFVQLRLLKFALSRKKYLILLKLLFQDIINYDNRQEQER